MKVSILLILLLGSVYHTSFAGDVISPPPSRELPPPSSMTDDDPELPSNNSGTGPSGTVSGINNILNNFTNPAGGGIPLPKDSGDWGLKNLRLDTGFTLTSFDDSSTSVNSSGHFRDYYLSLTGDLTEKDSISVGISNSRYETGGANGILARTYGLSFTWIHNLTENYGLGLFGFVNDVDIEEINGNSFCLGSPGNVISAN